MADGTEFDSTVQSAASAFEALLFPEDTGNTPETREQPQEEPEASSTVSDDAEASPEQADAEDESADTDEEQPAAESEAPAPAVEKHKVTIHGTEEEVTLEELKKGYSRTADYTRKTQAHAAEKKAFETERAAVRDERQKYAAYLTQLEQVLQANAGETPDWAELQKTMKPEEFAAAYAKHQIKQQELEAVQAHRQRAEAAVRRDQQEQLNAHLAAEEQKLIDAIPTWKDAKVANDEKTKMVAYAAKMGWSEQDLEQVVDHRNIVMLRKAMLFDEQEAKRPAVKAKIEQVRAATPGPAAQPSKRPVTDSTKARQRLAKTGSVQDMAAALMHVLPD